MNVRVETTTVMPTMDNAGITKAVTVVPAAEGSRCYTTKSAKVRS